jgi:hypothetical protein
MTTFQAKCHCGSVSLDISADPIAQIHCHCLDCQKAHGAAYISSAIFPANAVSINGDLTTFILHSTRRMRCSNCGMHMLSEIESAGMRSVNAYALPDGYFRPQMHVQCQHAVHPVVDDLPHFKAFPAAFGGTDEIIGW